MKILTTTYFSFILMFHFSYFHDSYPHCLFDASLVKQVVVGICREEMNWKGDGLNRHTAHSLFSTSNGLCSSMNFFMKIASRAKIRQSTLNYVTWTRLNYDLVKCSTILLQKSSRTFRDRFRGPLWVRYLKKLFAPLISNIVIITKQQELILLSSHLIPKAFRSVSKLSRKARELNTTALISTSYWHSKSKV